ncbi:hypothetical protein [Streptomyces goshikiensis]|uniref:hypothetical protein n=1 Tax=Streptomyces goshikiensis TaxID=1942 RepID=UPI0022F38B7C|nr:hypothetical protein [Streptomyces goshikiensis]WBY20024.1 hypothetical protein PET44_10520 [Streptomyces goshikiensis]
MIRRTQGRSTGQRLAGEREIESKLEIQTYVIDKLRELRNLPYDWDGAGGSPVSQDVAQAAYRALDRIADFRTVFPFITPGEEGSVLLEWRAGRERIELEFFPDDAPFVRHVDSDGHVRINGALGDSGTGYGEVRRSLSNLSSRIWVANPGWKSLFS